MKSRQAIGLAALLTLAATAQADELELRVLEGRRPLAGVRVTAIPLAEGGAPQIGGTTAHGSTATDGRLTLAGLDRGPYRLQAVAPDGRQAENEVSFPPTGPLRGVMLIHPHGPPDAMHVVVPPAAAHGTAVPVTVRATDEHDQPCRDGSSITLSTDLGVLEAGRRKAARITVTTDGGQAAAKLLAGQPGQATITAKCGDSETEAEVTCTARWLT